MLSSPTRTRRVAGRLLVVTAVAAALPLTASRAIAYVDVPAPAAPPAPALPTAPNTAAAAVTAVQSPPAPVAAVRPAARVAPTASYAETDVDGDMTINPDFVIIDGKRKRWEDLTPAEYARVKAAVAKARTALANTHIDQAKLQRDLANVPDQARIDDIQRKLAGTRAKLSESIRRIDAEAAEARASGREPDRLEAAIRERLQAAESVDFEAASRALAGIDRRKIAAQVADVPQAIARAKAELERVQARIDADPRH